MVFDPNVPPLRPLGHLNVETFLLSKSGATPGVARVEIQLIDAGMIRPFVQEYQWARAPDGRSLTVTGIGRGRPATATLPVVVDLTPGMIAFFGAYDGDGNKTGDIGFAQNEAHLQDYVFDSLRVLFGSSFGVEVNILEDSRYFEGDDVIDRMQQIREELVAEGIAPTDITDRLLMEHVLLERYHRQFPGAPPIGERIRYTISPLKGARSAGQSSFEIIRKFTGSRRFLPLLMDITKQVILTIYEDRTTSGETPPSLVWDGQPHSFAHQVIDTGAFVASDRCGYGTTRGFNRYRVVRAGNNELEISKATGNAFTVRQPIAITPLLSLMFGLYLAEGTTAKSKFFTFREQPEDLALGFNSSEEITLVIFLLGLNTVFSDPSMIIDEWLVKIGTKYFAESVALGEKLGVPVARGGNKGQGVSRSVEVTLAVKQWALNQFPALKHWQSKYSHIEFTGSGIARVDVRCKSASAPFLFALIHDLVFDPVAVAFCLQDTHP